jgi:hypothetical protein
MLLPLRKFNEAEAVERPVQVYFPPDGTGFNAGKWRKMDMTYWQQQQVGALRVVAAHGGET